MKLSQKQTEAVRMQHIRHLAKQQGLGFRKWARRRKGRRATKTRGTNRWVMFDPRLRLTLETFKDLDEAEAWLTRRMTNQDA